MADELTLLWQPNQERLAKAKITAYMASLAQGGRHFSNYEELWQWSVDDLQGFWQSIWEYFDVKSSHPYQQVLANASMPGAAWFEGSKLNFAEQIFRFNTEGQAKNKIAIIAESETRDRVEMTWGQLHTQITAVANTLRAIGVQPGDRVVAYLPNIPETVVIFYACASIGAIWSSCSPDMGHSSVLDRFKQIDPKVLIAVDGYRYGGKEFNRLSIVDTMRHELTTLEHTILLPYLDQHATLPDAMPWSSLFSHPAAQVKEMQFEQVAFNHPLWILYSSGTTGMPKPIVHSQGGSLIESLKSSALHQDLGEDDRFLWFSTTGWVMWNAQIVGLMVGSTICIYDGNPGYPDMRRLWRFTAENKLTFFGAGAAFFSNCMKAGVDPATEFDLSHLRSVGSTGSPLVAEAYQWIYQHVKADLLLASISGGTDTAAAFVTACPIAPLYAGEMQCRALGVAVYAFDESGKALTDEVGELVITKPMPSMPLYFWNDKNNLRYLDSYFDHFPGLWRHGDWIKITPRGGAVIYGRSDATINRHGIRMGTAEIYRVVEDLPEVLDSMVVDLEYLGRESYMPLFVVLREGVILDAPLEEIIRNKIRTQLSARHVPNEVIAVAEIPRTLTGKKMELPIKKLMLGSPIEKIANPDAMSNPDSLKFYSEFAQARNVLNEKS